jgi:hypothetical protein
LTAAVCFGVINQPIKQLAAVTPGSLAALHHQIFNFKIPPAGKPFRDSEPGDCLNFRRPLRKPIGTRQC